MCGKNAVHAYVTHSLLPPDRLIASLTHNRQVNDMLLALLDQDTQDELIPELMAKREKDEMKKNREKAKGSAITPDNAQAHAYRREEQRIKVLGPMFKRDKDANTGQKCFTPIEEGDLQSQEPVEISYRQLVKV